MNNVSKFELCKGCGWRSKTFCILNKKPENEVCYDWKQRVEVNGWTIEEILAREG